MSDVHVALAFYEKKQPKHQIIFPMPFYEIRSLSVGAVRGQRIVVQRFRFPSQVEHLWRFDGCASQIIRGAPDPVRASLLQVNLASSHNKTRFFN